MRPRIAISAGDPRGIGPEVVRAALGDPRVAEAAEFRVVGPEGVVQGVPLVPVGRWEPGMDPAQAGRLAGLAVREAAGLALRGEADALVTAPLDKAALHAGGWDFPGHTEMLQHLTGVPAVAMMMAADRTAAGGPLRVVLATTHLALRDVPARLSAALLVEQARLTHRALRHDWRIPEPRIALCAVNPHAGDGGRFGDEEERVIAPALRQLRDEGTGATGPVPADTVFVRAIRGEWDAVIAPYHDVGMAAFKTATFGKGVNVTLGLPFPRTSPDHGTALDIAGRGVADPSSMIAAILLAVRLARGRGFDTAPDPF